MDINDYVCFTVPFPPSLNRYYVKTRNGTFISKHGRKFRKDVENIINEQLPAFKSIDYKIKVGVILYSPDWRTCDLDNYNKGLLDAITHAEIWDDDSLIDQLLGYRGEVVKGGKAVVIIMHADPIIPNNCEHLVIQDMRGE